MALQPRRVGATKCDAASGVCTQRGVLVSIADGQGLTFCRNCRSAHAEGGVLIDTWEGAARRRNYHVHGELVLAVPFDASVALMNPVGGAAVLVARGNVSLSDKARAVPHGQLFRNQDDATLWTGHQFHIEHRV